MQYQNPYLFILGLVFWICWVFSFFKIGQKERIPIGGGTNHSTQFKLLTFFSFSLGTIGIGLMTYALMRPRIPFGNSQTKIHVNDIFLVVDVSRSMEAVDLPPNRLEVSKAKLKEFVELRPKDRIGVILFSEKVYTLLPLTTDSELIIKLLGEIRTGVLGSGTNIGDALGLAVARAQMSQTKNKVIVLLTDGVSNVGVLSPRDASEKAKSAGVRIYSIGIGASNNAKMPMGNGAFGRRLQYVPGGALDMETLNFISENTGGKAFVAGDKKSLKEIFEQINKLERSEIEAPETPLFNEKFAFFLYLGVACFGLAEILRRCFQKIGF